MADIYSLHLMRGIFGVVRSMIPQPLTDEVAF
jgi:hypothetical protein